MNILKLFSGGANWKVLAIIFIAYQASAPLIAEAPKLLALVVAPLAIIAMTRYSIARSRGNNYKFGWNSHSISEVAAVITLVFAAIHFSF